MVIVEELATFVATDAALHDIFRVILTMGVALFSLSLFLKRERDQSQSRWLAHPAKNSAKRACEIWFLAYGAFWISCFGYIIASQVYLQFTELGYMVVCGGLAMPLLLQPILMPSITCDQGKPLLQRFSFKANVWIFIFGFIGNYWSEIFTSLPHALSLDSGPTCPANIPIPALIFAVKTQALVMRCRGAAHG